MTKTVEFVSIQQVGWSYNGGFYINGIFGIFDILVVPNKDIEISLDFGKHTKNYHRVTKLVTNELIKAVENNFYCWQSQNIMLYLIQQI